MPKIGKATKTKRDRAVLKGLPVIMAGRERIDVLGERLTIDRIAERFHEHLRAMALVAKLTIDLRTAVQKEREIESALLPFIAAIKNHAEAGAGQYSSVMRDRGFEPAKKPVMSAVTKLLANVKRQATRKKRGIVAGRRKRRRAG